MVSSLDKKKSNVLIPHPIKYTGVLPGRSSWKHVKALRTKVILGEIVEKIASEANFDRNISYPVIVCQTLCCM